MLNKTQQNLLLLFLIAVTALALYGCSKLYVFHDLEAFFPSEDPLLDIYNEHRERFGSDDNFLFFGLVSHEEEGVFKEDFLQKAEAFRKGLEDMPHVTDVSAITNIKELIYTPIGATRIPILHLDAPEKIPADKERILADERIAGRFVSEDAQVLAVILTHEERIPESDMQQMMAAVDEYVKVHPFDELRVAGRPHTVNVVVTSISREFGKYAIISSILALGVMGLLLRRTIGVIVSIIAVVLGLIWFMSIIGYTGKALDIMSPLFPALMIVVGMSDMIHILSKYLDETAKGKDRKSALQIAIKEIGLATLLTSITTAVGFISLYTSNIVSIKGFGLYAAIGVLVVYVAVVLYTIAILERFPPNKLGKTASENGFWERAMEAVYQWVKTRQIGVTIGSFVLLALCLWGISKVGTNTYMLDDLPQGHTVSEDMLFFEDRLNGVRVFEVSIEPQKEHKINDPIVLAEIQKFHDYLNSKEDVGTPFSPVTIYKSLHKANNGSSPAYYRLPDSTEAKRSYAKYNRQIKKAKADQLNDFMTADRQYGRLTANMRDIGSVATTKLNTEIQEWWQKNIDPELLKFQLTGTALLVDKNHEYLRSTLFSGLGVAFIAVSCIMALLFRDPKMVLISMIPNVFPLLITGAVMGFSGIALKASTSIVFMVAFGIAVDDTIHFLSKFKLQRDKGASIEEALHITILETGKALCLTTMILFAGFFILVTSTFKATFYIGLLVSITLITALLADLLLLPVFIRWVYRKAETN